jgi:CheY-like chemotaxis protein
MSTLLIVDDSRVMRQIVIRTLRQAGHGEHDIVEADNGRTALAAVTEHRPDLILSDWNMPEMSGIQFLTALRATGDTTTFGFVTSEGSETMREQALAAGARFLIAKPFTAEVFADHLDPVLSGSTGGRQVATERDDDTEESGTALPDRKAVRDLLEGLINKACPIGDGSRVSAHAGAVGVTVGEIITDHGDLAAVLLADQALSVYAGAALSLTPPAGAQDMAADGDVSAPVRAAFAEVLNVLSAVFNVGTAQHVRLGRVWVGTEGLPPSVAGAARDVARRDDLKVTVAGYGTGNLSIVLTGA